jgi:hypothetical protein
MREEIMISTNRTASSRVSTKGLFAIAMLLCSIAPSFAAGPVVSERQQLRDMFSQIRIQTKWNIDGDMRWGYFFAAPDAKSLQAPGEELKKMGYQVMSINPTDEKNAYWLHVEKVEKHSPDSLSKRANELRILASKYKSVEYDGVDVTPVEKK